MFDQETDALIDALLNSTRREILRRLLLDQSYAFQISKILGLSQQAINKQLELLERANLISMTGFVPSSSGAPRKIYRPTNFSTLIVDYSPNFIDVRRYRIPIETQRVESRMDEPARLIADLRMVNSRLDAIMEERTQLINEKDRILGSLHRMINEMEADDFTKSVLLEYVDTLDAGSVSKRFGISQEIVQRMIEIYLRDVFSH
ncbi:MAG TPA: helix-turn-helix domain-containing protein [Thermoplasmataceae archaeon]|nr:helix-turn-helix domain-containing protein [Thermoplasmatales archaeon AK]HLH86310.1 helix-turn-helix domain-containing protein [Thermoplasmataceae archaeon]